MHGSWARGLVFVMPIELRKRPRITMVFLPKIPKYKQTMLESDFLIIGGQHTIDATRDVMNDSNFANQDMIKALLLFPRDCCCAVVGQRESDVHVQRVELENP